MPVRRARHRVAVLIETSNAYARGLLRGVRAYAQEHGGWTTFLVEHGRGDPPPRWVAGWSGHGIVARIENRAIANAVRRSGVPVVDVSAARLLPDTPWVETDDTAIARVAFDHLVGRGFTRFAYCGDDRFNWSRWRGEAFAAKVRGSLHECRVYSPPAADDPEKEMAAIVRWVRRLPKPIGVMACYDVRGRQVIDACRRIGVSVPDEVAVIGVDNDELLCDLCDPPLSSVQSDALTTGYTAAELLERMMTGETVEPEATLVEPIGVVARGSTDALAIDDPYILQAMRFIREHACDEIRVDDVLERVPMSRRVFESRFRTIIGHTPHEEITRLRIDRARELLRETDLPMSQIAPRVGLRHPEYLCTLFKKRTGTTPTDYRRKHAR